MQITLSTRHIEIIQSALAVVTGNDKGLDTWTLLMEIARQTHIHPDPVRISNFRVGRVDLDCTPSPHHVD